MLCKTPQCAVDQNETGKDIKASISEMLGNINLEILGSITKEGISQLGINHSS